MDRDDYLRTQELLSLLSFAIFEKQYSSGAFGSWYIVIRSNPRFRVLWDGKDEWLLVQRETDERFAGMKVWVDCAVAKDRPEQTPEWAVRSLSKFADKRAG